MYTHGTQIEEQFVADIQQNVQKSSLLEWYPMLKYAATDCWRQGNTCFDSLTWRQMKSFIDDVTRMFMTSLGR